MLRVHQSFTTLMFQLVNTLLLYKCSADVTLVLITQRPSFRIITLTSFNILSRIP